MAYNSSSREEGGAATAGKRLLCAALLQPSGMVDDVAQYKSKQDYSQHEYQGFGSVLHH
ncbi:MAG: hypothetical protein JNL13_05550 [Chitinophagaceae bacterium]|nr:hypothetical protein [Chitinophagaceae bacterium]